MTRADMTCANMTGAYMTRANMTGANMTGADMTWSNMTWANMTGAIITGVNLTGAQYSVSTLLRVDWGKLSDELTLELMRHDAESCGTKAMTKWAKGGPCPFEDSQRDFLFVEREVLWKPGKPKLRGMKLLRALASEKGITL